MTLAELRVNKLFGNLVSPQKKHYTLYDVPKDFDEALRSSVLPKALTEFKTGERHEVLDRKGNVNYANLDMLIRQKILTIHWSNPKQSGISPFEQVGFLGIVQLNLLSLLKDDSFASDHKVRVKGDISGDDESLDVQLGEKNHAQGYEIPEWVEVRKKLGAFAWNFGKTHNAHVDYEFNRSEGVPRAMKALHQDDFVADTIMSFFKLASTSDNETYLKNVHKDGTGEAGKAMQLIFLLIKNIVELSNNTRGDRSPEEYFKDNMFYKLISNLGKDASGKETMRKPKALDAFFFKVIGESISNNPDIDTTSLYRRFVITQLEKEKDKYDDSGTPEERKEKKVYRLLIQRKISEVTSDLSLEIKIDTNDALEEVRTQLSINRGEEVGEVKAAKTAEEGRLGRKLKSDEEKAIKDRIHNRIHDEILNQVRLETKDSMVGEDPENADHKSYLEQFISVDRVYNEKDKKGIF